MNVNAVLRCWQVNVSTRVWRLGDSECDGEYERPALIEMVDGSEGEE